jgi:hypothetical protein
MIEYKVAALETVSISRVEELCNELAQQGWRLVSTAAANAGGITVRGWLFFEREVKTLPGDDLAGMAARLATSAAATR